MLTHPSIDKLRSLRLPTMADAWLAQQTDASYSDLDFDSRLAMLIDAECMTRQNKRLSKFLRDARLRIPGACIEDIDMTAARELDKRLIKELATGAWIQNHITIVITGMTGVGKTYLACALGQLACRKGFRVLYHRLPRLLPELALAHADGSFSHLLARFAKADVLILDDWGLGPLSDSQRRDLLELIEDRYAARSTIITSQLDLNKWHDYIADPTLADAILDRLVHGALKIHPKGPSKRKIKETQAL